MRLGLGGAATEFGVELLLGERVPACSSPDRLSFRLSPEKNAPSPRSSPKTCQPTPQRPSCNLHLEPERASR
ncbi:MAG: hypothetical protein KAI47_19065 [Deltaproteobacteria bacterium]|nr:hypothetical protein [Deltaproteobacteria bacterium]